MAGISVTLSANAGVAIAFGGKKIWVDALHTEKQSGFSALTPVLQRKMLECKAFSQPDHICVTHCHPDHHSHGLMQIAKRLWPKAKLLLPEREFPDQVLIEGEIYAFSDGDLTMEFLRLPHEGAQYAHVRHYGLLLQWNGKRILIAGDCATASPALAQALRGRQVDLAILDFPWITLRKGREFLQNILRQRLPDAEVAAHLL